MMQYDLPTANDTVKLAHPIKEMDALTYDILGFLEALPKEERRLVKRFVIKRAAANGWLKGRLNFKRDKVHLLHCEKKKR